MSVVNGEFTTSFGMGKEEFREVYFSFMPGNTEENFDTAWSIYAARKAEHIKLLNDRLA